MLPRSPLLWLLLALPVAAELSQPFVDPGDAKAWDTARDAARLAREFVDNTIASATDGIEGPVLDWRFELREGGFADIFCRRRVEAPFDRLRLRVRNLGEGLTLAVKLGDDGGAEWTVTPQLLPAGDAWRTVEFPWTDWRVASWSKDVDGELSLPCRYLAVIAFGVRPGPSYRLQLGRIELVREDPAPAQVDATVPTRLRAGDSATITVRLTPRGESRSVHMGGRLELVKDGAVVQATPLGWSPAPTAWRPGVAAGATVTMRLSAWQAGGPHRWRLWVPGWRDEAEGAPPDRFDLGEVEIMARTAHPPVVELRRFHGAPTIFIDGRPVPGMAYAAYGPSPKVFEEFGAAGVRLFSVMGTPTSHGYGLAADCWLEPGHYDYTQLDQRFRMVLDACPDAYLFPRLYVSAPPWWLAEHPEAVVLYDPGDGTPVPFEQNGRHVPSWASPAWREATCDALRRLIAHVESQPYADRVIGYHIASGTTEEWMMWGANDDAWTDYSPDNIAAFRRWLSARYRDDATLRAAWGDPDVTLATATVPPRRARAYSAAGVLRNPDTDTPSIDYVRYIADMTAETIDLLCATVKDATGGQRLAGVFYGYLLQLFGQRQQNAAHLAFDAVVRSRHIDFLCSPTSYAFRAIGTGTTHVMAPLGSVLAHDKLWFDENDIRTSLSPGKVGDWGRPENVDGDILQQDRELAMVLTGGVAQWWFDVGANRYDDARLMAHLAHLTRVAAETLTADRTPVDQVAMVVDGRGLANINVGDRLMAPLMLNQIPTLARIGAPVGHYELSDVDRLERHRLVLFAGLYEPTAEQRAAIDRLKSGGRVLVFTHAPAPYREGRWAPEGMAEVSGLELRIEDRELPPRVTFSGDDPLVAGLAGAYGTDAPTRPTVVAATQSPAAVLGTLPDGSPGLVVRRYPDWTAVWSAAPNLPTDLLVRLAELAGVHRFVTTPDVVWASRELLALNVNDAGPRLITLPGPARVTDLYAGQPIAEKTDRFEVAMPAGATKLWRVEPR